MLKTTLFRTAISIGCLLTITGIASADTKIKSRQTSGGQTYENTSYIKGKRQRSETNNGQMIVIQQCDLRRNLQIMPAAKAYMIQPYDEPSPTTPSTSNNTSQPTATTKGGVVTSTVITKDTGERKQMFGYTARHIITTMEMKSSPDACSTVNNKMEIDGWYIDAAFALDCDSSRAYTNYKPRVSGGCRDRYETKTIGTAKKGFPVWEKTTMIGPNGAESFSTTNEVLEFSQATLDASLFEVPEGYREVQDFASAFAAAYATPGANNPSGNESATSTPVPSTPTTPNLPATPALGPKRAGVIRLGVAAVRTGNVAEGMNASELALAVRNSLLQQLKGTNVEAVPIEATGAAIQAEAQQKECDYVVYANVSHKKGGGGFGSMLGNSASAIAGNVGYGHGTAAAVAANTTSVVVAQNIKAKDEMTLDVRLERPGSTTPSFAQQFKGKAKSAGEDIITPLVQQACQSAMQAVAKP
ncbi:MAG TPA: hypothetical protein VHS05_09190 [Pyrinomonadaceae bacterium]|jgi:hypothetical protein|nr:hypothetical protein [Pyrinomonadaceae bacterium]